MIALVEKLTRRSLAQQLLTQLLLSQASELRAALDGPWRGLWLELERGMDTHEVVGGVAGAGAGNSTATAVDSAPCQIVGVASGGGKLVVRGGRGGEEVLPFVRQHWQLLRGAQERHALLREVRRAWYG
jgi:hypothetical protein